MRSGVKKLAILLLAMLCEVFLFVGAEAYAANAPGDSVKIVSVSPDAVLDYSRPVTFSVVIEYSLFSENEATLYLAFNTTKPDAFTVYDQVTVCRGAETMTLSTTITPVGWGTSYAPKGTIGNFVDSIFGHRFQAKAALAVNSKGDGAEVLLDVDARDINHGTPTVDLELDSLLQTTVSTEYSPELSLFLMQLADAAYQDEDGIREFYVQMGFPREDIRGEYAEKTRFDWDSAKFTIGQKFLSNGEQLVLISVRGTEGDIISMSPDWISNFYMGDAYSEIAWHQGFKLAAYELYNFLKDDYFDGSLPKNHVKYVLTGHSRGAAIANLVSVLLMEEGVAQQNLYDYNFACPDVARDMAENWNPNGIYDNIFNIGNCSDPIPQLPGLVGDTLPFALDFFSHKDKWSSKVIDALNQTSVEQLYTSWGKYGRTYWFSENWGYAAGLLPDFLSHDQKCYISYLSKQLPLSEMKSWVETKSLVLSNGPSLRTVVGIFLCPVEVVFKDPEGNILVSVKDGALEYTSSEDCFAVILTDGDKKIVSIRSDKELEVEMLGTAKGSMSMVLMEGDSICSEITDAVAYENIKLQTGKKVKTVVDPAKTLGTLQVVTLDKNGDARAQVQEDGKEVRLGGVSGFAGMLLSPLCILLLITTVLFVIIAILIWMSRQSKRKQESYDLFSPLPPPQDSAKEADIICSCGATNPPWVKNCIACGRKLKKRR